MTQFDTDVVERPGPASSHPGPSRSARRIHRPNDRGSNAGIAAMGRLRRRALFGFLAAILAGAFVATAQPASAYYAPSIGHCSGYSLVGVYPARNGNATVGNLLIYWSAAKGRNCAIMQTAGPTANTQRKTITVKIFSCYVGNRAGDYCDRQWDSNISGSGGYYGGYDAGSYREYAGAVTAAGRGRCIGAIGAITYKTSSGTTVTIHAYTGNKGWMDMSTGAAHCG